MQFKKTWQALTNVVRYFGCLRLLKKLPAIVWFGKLLPLLQKATAMCGHVQKSICFFFLIHAGVSCMFSRQMGTLPVGKSRCRCWKHEMVHCNFDWTHTHTHSYTFYHIFLIAFNLSNGFFQCDWLMSIAGRRIGLRTSWYVAYCFGIRGDAPLKSSGSIIAWFAMEHNSRRRTLPPPFSMIWSQSVYIDRLHVILYCIYFYLFNIYLYMHHYHVSNIYSIASSKQISKIFQWN